MSAGAQRADAVFAACGHPRRGNTRRNAAGDVCATCTHPDTTGQHGESRARRILANRRMLAPAFCAVCADGRCVHRGQCTRTVAPEPNDYVCACGSRRPVHWRTAVAEMAS
jgi:hypothetical protein